jgi:DNA-binding IclR family transcriptional regulator
LQDSRTAESSASVAALRRGLSVLDVLSASGGPLGVNEIARQVGVHKSTVSRLCATLEAAGYLRREPATNRFTLGPRIFQLAGVASQDVDLRATARPVLHELVTTCRETASLTVLQDDEVVTVDVVDGLDFVRMHSRVGMRTELHASAGAKAMLAWLPPDRLDAILRDRPMPALTPNTITDRAAFEEHLAEVRRRGYSTDVEELEIGLRCVGAAVRDPHGGVVAGISLSGPRHRMTPEVMALLGRLVAQAAEQVSARLGAPPAPAGHQAR